MGLIGVSFCDICGKRTDIFKGRLALTEDVEERSGFKHTHTIRSWRLCKSCLNRVSAMRTDGDRIKEEIEIKLDEIRFKRNEFKLLEGEQ